MHIRTYNYTCTYMHAYRKQLRKRGHKDRLYPGGEFALDPVADQSYEEEMEDVPSHMSSEGWEGRQQFAGAFMCIIRTYTYTHMYVRTYCTLYVCLYMYVCTYMYI